MTAWSIDGVSPVVHETAFVHPQACLIGDVVIGPECYIGPFASLRGDYGRIEVRTGSNVQDSCTVHVFPGQDTILDEGSHIGHGAVLHGCHLEPGVLVGMNSVVMDGTRIGARSLVAAHSFVRAGGDYAEESLIAGSPAKLIRRLDEVTLAWKANGSHVYRELAARSLATLHEVTPLREEEPDRKRVSTGRDTSTPLHELRAEGA
ncbi:phenylacetic acid degradation protein PaaY [Nocardioides sp. JQ2195]|uniref:transferase hexapeptide repeat family protein n=1 Tax=Nocardioides sp. JQ2195 TaxID=2592334 RepID=UPI00143E5FFE|nr:transferase hexapeptide repeat family protein [Nocardioides sp. JQ2195]QIX26569.1 phenylacetic acid degradation protein PaaY [Nocardioides sp. JQ2195]